MKIKKIKYIGPVDSYMVEPHASPSCYGSPIMTRNDFSRNGALNLKNQSLFYDDGFFDDHSDTSKFKYIERI